MSSSAPVPDFSSLEPFPSTPLSAELHAFIHELEHDPKVKAIGIFGSYSTTSETSHSDIDLAVLVNETEFIPRETIPLENKEIEVWYHPLSAYQRIIKQDIQTLSDFFTFSVYLQILREMRIFYDPEGIMLTAQRRSIHWKWPAFLLHEFVSLKENYYDLSKNSSSPLLQAWFSKQLYKLSFNEPFIRKGRPFLSRNKDLFRLFATELTCFSSFSSSFLSRSFTVFQELEILLDRVLKQVVPLGVRNWNSISAAKHALKSRDYFRSLILLDDSTFNLIEALVLAEEAPLFSKRTYSRPFDPLHEFHVLSRLTSRDLIKLAISVWKQMLALYRTLYRQCFSHSISLVS